MATSLLMTTETTSRASTRPIKHGSDSDPLTVAFVFSRRHVMGFTIDSLNKIRIHYENFMEGTGVIGKSDTPLYLT